ncbi:MAG: glycosyltransferase family 2 protein [Planctomycetota bacterium]
MSELPGISLVVPNYRGADLLRRYAPTWTAAAARYPGPAEVLVVDDGSGDDSLEVLAGIEGVRALAHEVNQGFGAACRTGAEAAAHELVVLLNSDVAADPDFLAPLARVFAQDPDAFSVSPLILDKEGQPSKVTVNLPYLRHGDLRWRGVDPADLLRLAALPPEEPLLIYSLFGLGGALALRRARFLALGGFDPLYRPFYHEDTDLGLCAWRRGWTVRVEPRSQVRHDDGGTIGRHFAPFRVKVARRRHRILCGWKHAEGPWRADYARTLRRRALTKWLRLDLRFYAALWGAWQLRPDALRGHEQELAQGSVPLGEAFARITASWPPPQLAALQQTGR